MKDYTEFMVDAYAWQANRPRFYLEELMPNSTSDTGIIAGRLGLGKTNLALELAVCFATGDKFFELEVEKIPVVYLDFEGNQVNITERLEKILKRHPTPPANYLNLTNLKNDRFVLHNNFDRLVDETKGAKLAIIDGGKHLIEGAYIKPERVKVFGEDLTKAMNKAGIATILTWQIRKPHEETLIAPGDIFTLKGAADLVEDATFVILIEKPRPWKEGKVLQYPPDKWVNLYFAKAKEGRRELLAQELIYDYTDCQFRKRV